MFSMVLWLLLGSFIPTHQAPMKRSTYEPEHVHADAADSEEDPHFFKMVYVKIMHLLQQEEFAKKNLVAANAVIEDAQAKMKDKSMDILNLDRGTDMDRAQEILNNYRFMTSEELGQNYKIEKTPETTEKLVQLTIDTNVYLVQELIKALKLTIEEMGISKEDMETVKTADTHYFKGETSVPALKETLTPADDRKDTVISQEEETEILQESETPSESSPVKSTSSEPIEEPTNPKFKKPVTDASTKKSGADRLGVSAVQLILAYVLYFSIFY